MRRMPFTTVCSLVAAAAAAAFVPASVNADEPASTAAEMAPLFAVPALPDQDLGNTRGAAGLAIMGDVAINLAGQSAAISDNTINAPTTTGTISGNTVQDVRGVSMFNLNSGNFNSFQNTFQLNIQLGQ